MKTDELMKTEQQQHQLKPRRAEVLSLDDSPTDDFTDM